MLGRTSVLMLAFALVMGVPVSAALADEQAVLRRDDDYAEVVAVDDDDDGDSNTGNTGGGTSNSNDGTGSRWSKASAGGDRSVGDNSRDWTRDGSGDRKRDWSGGSTNDSSRNDTR